MGPSRKTAGAPESRSAGTRRSRRSVRKVAGRAVDDRQRAEARLEASEERYRALYEDNPSMYFTVDRGGMVLSVNKFGAEQLGYRVEELVGRPVLEVFHDDDKEAVRLQLAQCLERVGRVASWEFRKIRSDGSSLWVREHVRTVQDADGNPIVLIVCEDITEQKRAEEARRELESRVRHAQKLESLGLMAGGIAHDFNNLLVGILGNAALALSKLAPGSSARRDIQSVEKAAERAADLCKQLLAYSGRGRFEVQAVDLSALVADMQDLLEVAVSKRSILRYELAGSLPVVEADPGQLRQVVLNLVTNAAEAIGDRTGIITVRTLPTEVEKDYESPVVGRVSHGAYVSLEVTDTGCGMDRDTASRIFDPFFTTKFTGRGLGLAAVLGIVRGHRGAIDLTTAPGRGTTFRAIFPCSLEALEARTTRRRSATSPRGSGTILVIDDEPVVRSVAKQSLERAGFDVVTASNGSEGIATFSSNRERIRLILLDLTMPGLSGEESFQILRTIKPDVPVVLSSGYEEQEVSRRFEGQGLEGFVQKPYRPDELVARVHIVLGGRPEPSS